MTIESDQQYFNEAWPLCLEASASCGVRPEIIFAQSAVETGYGLHEPQNNFFGIKGKGGSLVTTEYINGVATRLQQHFAGYGSMAASFMGYADFLRNNRRYKTFRAGTSLAAQLVALGTSGYATDPNYAMKVGAIVDIVPGYMKGYNLSLLATASNVTARQAKVIAQPIAETANMTGIGTTVDKDVVDPIRNWFTELTAHKTGLQVATGIITQLLPFAPIPAAAATGISDVVNGLNALAAKPVPKASPLPPVTIEPVPQPATSVPTPLSEAIAEGEKFLSEGLAQLESGNLTEANILLDAEGIGKDVVQDVENSFNPALGIAKNPNAN